MLDLTGRHPGTVAKMRAFTYDHLAPELAALSRPFCDLAEDLVGALPDDPELTNALDFLRSAKDRAVGLAAWLRDTPQTHG